MSSNHGTAMAVPSNIWSVEGGELKLNLHEGQTRAWQSKRRFVFVLAGTQGGKTSFGVWWLWREIRERGGGDYLAVTSSYDLFKLKMLPTLRECFESVLGIGRYWSGDRIIEIADPVRGFLAKRADDSMYARIILRSAAAGGGLESATAKAAWLDEVGQDSFALEDYEAVLRRLSLHTGRVLGTTTLYNAGWLKNEVYDKWQAGDRDIDVVQFPSYINPNFPRAEFLRAKRTMQRWRFLMFYTGTFSKPVGLILGDLKAHHIVKPFEVPAHWARFLGLDFGGANTAQVWLAHDQMRDRFYLYREGLDGDKTTKEHASAIIGHAQFENLVQVWGGAPSETQPRRDFAAEGVDVERPPIADVEAGIDRIVELIKGNRLFVFDTCRGFLDEAGSYRRKLDARGNPTNEIEDKRKYHRIDALRYVASGVVSGGKSFAYGYTGTANRAAVPTDAETVPAHYSQAALERATERARQGNNRRRTSTRRTTR